MAVKTISVCLTFLSLFFDCCCCKFIPINACILCHLSIDWSLLTGLYSFFMCLLKFRLSPPNVSIGKCFSFLGVVFLTGCCLHTVIVGILELCMHVIGCRAHIAFTWPSSAYFSFFQMTFRSCASVFIGIPQKTNK